MANNNGVRAFNYIRSNSSDSFRSVVPSATANNIGTLQNILFNDAYQPMLNEFIGNLINRIALTIVRNKSFSNPLSVFKKGSVPLGTDIQEIYTNPANAESYEYSDSAMAKLLTITDPDTKVAYYRRNRQDLFTKTISREGLQGAFASWEDFEDFISSITTSLYSGNYIKEFKYTKDLIDGAYENGKVIVETVSAPVDNATSKAFVKKVRGLFAKMSFPSTSYNAYSKFNQTDTPITTWTDSDRVVLIIKADVMAEIDVETLSQAFNLSYSDLQARIVQVDSFKNEEIQAIICDEAFLQIYDNIFRFDEFYNARTMSWNYYLHAWGTYAISPFANAVVLATSSAPAPTPAESVALDPKSLTMTTNDDPADVFAVVTPEGGEIGNLTWASSNENVFTVEASPDDELSAIVTAVGAGSGTLSVTSDDETPLTDSITVTVSAGE